MAAAAASATVLTDAELAAVKADLIELYKATPCMPCKHSSKSAAILLQSKASLGFPVLSSMYGILFLSRVTLISAVMVRLAWHDAGK
jgi:hypothetical protein